MNRDFLRNLDLGEGAHLPDAAIESIMAEHGKTIKQRDTTISTLQGQLNEANGKLTGYDPDWQSKADAAKKALEKQQFEFAIERGLSAARPRNAKAVAALLDMDKLKFAGGEVIGLDAQIKALKESEDTAFLFEQEQPQQKQKTGMSHQGGGDVGKEGGKNNYTAANNALRAALKGGK